MESIVLNNGINCLLHPMPNTHSVTIGLYIKAGVGYTEPLHGITHLLEHLHFRQLNNITQEDLYYRMESIGSTLRAATYRDLLRFSMKFAPHYFNKAIAIFVELINATRWQTDSFLKEKQVVLNQIYERGFGVSIEEEARACIFKNHPLGYSIMGSPEDLESIGLKDVVNYKKLVFNPENMWLCVTGNFTPADKEQMVHKLQSCKLTYNHYLPTIPYPSIFHNRKPDIVLNNVDDTKPLDVNISFDITINKGEAFPLTILNCILGEGVGSHLQRLIREQKCFSANIESYVERYLNIAILHIRFSVEKKNLYPCLEAVMRVAQNLKSNIKKEDLDVTLPFYTTNQAFYNDDTEEMNFQIAYHQLCLGQVYDTQKIANDIHTYNELQLLASKIFQEKNCCVVVVGDTKGLTKKAVRQIIKAGLM